MTTAFFTHKSSSGIFLCQQTSESTETPATLAGPEEVKEPKQQEEDQAPASVMADYVIQLHTSNCRGTAVPGRVSTDLKGQRGSTGMQQLKPDHDEAFGLGQVLPDMLQHFGCCL